MSNPDFDRYKVLYNQMVTTIANYHNRHQDFCAKITEVGAQDLRRMLRELRRLEKEMGGLVWDAFVVDKKGIAEARRLKKELEALRKLNNPPRMGRPKKKNNNE
jgi:hypothetical protein